MVLHRNEALQRRQAIDAPDRKEDHQLVPSSQEEQHRFAYHWWQDIDEAPSQLQVQCIRCWWSRWRRKLGSRHPTKTPCLWWKLHEIQRSRHGSSNWKDHKLVQRVQTQPGSAVQAWWGRDRALFHVQLEGPKKKLKCIIGFGRYRSINDALIWTHDGYELYVW